MESAYGGLPLIRETCYFSRMNADSACHAPEFVVTYSMNGGRPQELIKAINRYRAADMLEKRHGPTCQVISVSATWPVAGRCFSCRSVLFADDRFERMSGERVMCFDCT